MRKSKLIKIVKWYLVFHLIISGILFVDYTFITKESARMTWEGRGINITKVILLGPLNIFNFK